MASSGPDLVKAKQLTVDQHHWRASMGHRRDAADRKTGLLFDKSRISTAQLGRRQAQLRRHLAQVDPAVAINALVIKN